MHLGGLGGGGEEGVLQALPSGVQGQNSRKLWIFLHSETLNSSKQKKHIMGLTHEWSFVCF